MQVEVIFTNPPTVGRDGRSQQLPPLFRETRPLQWRFQPILRIRFMWRLPRKAQSREFLLLRMVPPPGKT